MIKNNSEIIKYDKLIFSINEEDKTANVINNDNASGDVFIPKFIILNNQEYNVVSIKEGAFRNTKSLYSLNFPADSKVEKIEKDVFTFSSIESIFIPKSVNELEEGFCRGASKLKLIMVMPSNKQLMNIDNKMIVSKSKSNFEYDNLIFVRRDLKSMIIPSFIKRIGRYAFSESFIENIFIPSQVREICEGAFFKCKKLEHVEISKESELETIEPLSFMNTSISCINIPSSVKHLFDSFYDENIKVSEITTMDNTKINIDEFEQASELENNKERIITLIVNPKTNEKYMQTIIGTFFESNAERTNFIYNYNVMKRMTGHPGMMRIISFEEHPHPTIINEYNIICTLKEMITIKKEAISRSTFYIILYGILRTIEFLNVHNIYIDELESNKIYIDEFFRPRLLISFSNKNKRLNEEFNKEKLIKMKKEIRSYFKIVYELLTGRIYNEEECLSIISSIKEDFFKEFLQKHLIMSKTNNQNQPTISDIIEELESHKREIIGNDENGETEISTYEKDINIFVSGYLKEIQEESTDNIFYSNTYKEISSKNNKMKENENNKNKTEKIKEEQSKEPSESESKFQFEKHLTKDDVAEMNKEELAKYYKQEADQGDVESMFKYAIMLDDGDGIEENKKEAARYYKLAADQGHVDSMYIYALMNDEGDGIEENKKEASQYYKLAADQGHVESMYIYGKMIEEGVGIRKNVILATHYFKSAADKGHVDSMLIYAKINEEGVYRLKSIKTAAQYYKYAADKGHAIAMYKYASMCDKGDGIKENKKEAARYYKLTADQGFIL